MVFGLLLSIKTTVKYLIYIKTNLVYIKQYIKIAITTIKLGV